MIYIRAQYHRNWALHRRISRVILGQGMAIGHEIFVKEEERDQVEIDQKVENSPFLGVFSKSYKISQLIHTYSIAN